MRDFGCCTIALTLALGVAAVWPAGSAIAEEGTEPPAQRVQVAGVFVRRAFNEKAMVVVGFHTANATVGQKQVMLDVAMTTLGDHRERITTDDIRLITPTGEIFHMMSQEQFNQYTPELAMLVELANTQNDTVNYLPVAANVLVPIRFFTDPSQGGTGISSDDLSLSPEQACVGRIYFEIPDGTQYGNYALGVKFADGVLQVPFRMMTKEESDEFRQRWKEKMKSSKKKKKKKKKKDS